MRKGMESDPYNFTVKIGIYIIFIVTALNEGK